VSTPLTARGQHPAASRWIGNAIKNDAELRGVRPEFLGVDAYPVLRFRYQWRALRVAVRGESKRWVEPGKFWSEPLN
jgi:hypothetical protein